MLAYAVYRRLRPAVQQGLTNRKLLQPRISDNE